MKTKLLAVLLAPPLMAGACGVLTFGITGIALMKFANSKSGIELRKKMMTSVRDHADEMIEKLDEAAENLKATVEEKSAKATA
jgi:hypothetical protein